MSSLSGLGVGIRMIDFSSKTAKCRDMFFFIKDYLSIEDEKLFKACRSVCSSVGWSHPLSVKISTIYHNFLIDYCRDFSHILHICTKPQVNSLV